MFQREQCITAEEELSKLKDEVFNNKTMFQERTGKLVDRLELTTKVRHGYSKIPMTSHVYCCTYVFRLCCISCD